MDNFKEFLKKFKQRHPESYKDEKAEAMPGLESTQIKQDEESEVLEVAPGEEVVDYDEPENWWDK